MTRRPLTVEVLISTLGADGIRRVASMNLPQAEGVSYLVAWQRSDNVEIPAALAERPDIRIARNPGIGLSDNRNFALDRAMGDILVIADDDVEYTAEAFAVVRSAYTEYPGLDMALFRYRNAAGKFEKSYPDTQASLCRSIPKGYYVSSIEITLRRQGRAATLRFPEEFGIGAPRFGCGEEEIVLRRALRRGCDVRLFPDLLCTHCGDTTGQRRVTDQRVYRGMGAAVAYTEPLKCYLRFPLMAWRGARRGTMSFFPALAGFTSGALYASLRVFPRWRKEGGL